MSDWRLHCDYCGRFMRANEPGSSWAFVPDSDVSYEENNHRCAKCTAAHGKVTPRQCVRLDMCCGVVTGKGMA